MWRKYSISKGRAIQHRPLFIFDRKEFGDEVYYRVVCSHSGSEVKEWLSKTQLMKDWREMVLKYELKCKEVSELGRVGEEGEERVVECSVKEGKFRYKFRDRQGVILDVDSNFFIQFQKLPHLVRFL
jgi:heat shock protein HspQ